jgi:hypothetical protein
MFYDCKATAATEYVTGSTTPALPAFPSGPEECEKCFMVGTQVGCASCKDHTMYVDSMTGMCKHKDNKDHHVPMPVVKTNVAECPSEMEPFCKICHEGHFDNNGTQEFVRECLVCREGFVKGSKGNCYSESDHSAGE